MTKLDWEKAARREKGWGVGTDQREYVEITNRWPTRCALCNRRIAKGERVQWWPALRTIYCQQCRDGSAPRAAPPLFVKPKSKTKPQSKRQSRYAANVAKKRSSQALARLNTQRAEIGLVPLRIDAGGWYVKARSR